MTATVAQNDLVQVQVEGFEHLGKLNVPLDPTALVLFANGTNSSQVTECNRGLAAVLHRQHIATLLFDLLTDDQAVNRHQAFDIELLSQRIEQALNWVGLRPDLAMLRIGLFGFDTAAAAALVAAAQQPGSVSAVVSQSGRPDLATGCLALVDAPTLLIVGGLDSDTIEINRTALRLLRCNKRLEVVPGAAHLFEQPGALEAAAELTAEWFGNQLADRRYT